MALGGTAALAVLAVLPPAVGGALGDAIHHGFSVACHQIADRSPHVAGGPVALCHRCSGILGGLLVGIALMPLASTTALALVNRSRQGRWLLASVVPTAVDWALGAAGVWANVPASRVVTGMVFGLTAGVILGANLLAVRETSLTQPRLSL